MPSPSRSHWMAAPATKIDPPRAYATSSPVEQAGVAGPGAGGPGGGRLGGALDVPETPSALGGREVRLDGQAGPGADAVRPALVPQLVAERGRPAVLPHDGAMDGPGRPAIAQLRR